MEYLRLIPAIIIFMSSAAGIFAGQITVSSISVVSNIRTRDFIITQELEFEKGKTYDQGIFGGLISNSVQNLKNLGIFGDVNITYNLALNGSSADVIVAAGDKWTFFPIPIYYYDTRIGSSVMISLIEDNLAGLNQSLEIDYNYEYIPDLEGIDFQYSYPRIFGSYYNTKIAFSYESFIDSAYDMNQNILYKSYYSSYSNYIRLDRKYFAGGNQWVVFIESGIQYETNAVVINNDSQAVQNGFSFYPGIGVEEGVINYDLGTIWGNFYRARIDISPLSLGVQTELRADQYFRFWEKSGIAVRADFQSSSIDRILLTPDEIRGISLGQIAIRCYVNVLRSPITYCSPHPLSFRQRWLT